MTDIGKKLIAEWNYVRNAGYKNFGEWLIDFHKGKTRCYKGHWSRFDPEGRKPMCYGDR